MHVQAYRRYITIHNMGGAMHVKAANQLLALIGE